MTTLSPTLLVTALLTGLVGGLHCTTMCGGFALSVMHRSGARGVTLYTAGRLITYATLGALGGGFGALLLPLEQVGAVVSALLLIWFTARLAGVVRLPQPAQAGQTIHLGHAHVDQQGSGRKLLEQVEAYLPVWSLEHLEALTPKAFGQ